MPITALRRILLPPIDTVKQWIFGGFAVSHSTEDEYAATLYCDAAEMEQCLDTLGFSPSLFSALKIRVDGNVEDGSWVWRKSYLADGQLHLIAHLREQSRIDLYAHWERSKITHPVQHYRKIGYDAETGVSLFREMLKTHASQADDSIEYHIQSPRHRSGVWALHLLSYVSTPAAVRIGRTLDTIESIIRRRLPRVSE